MCGPSHNRLTMKLRDFKFQGPYHAQVFPKALEDMFFVVVVVKFATIIKTTVSLHLNCLSFILPLIPTDSNMVMSIFGIQLSSWVGGYIYFAFSELQLSGWESFLRIIKLLPNVPVSERLPETLLLPLWRFTMTWCGTPEPEVLSQSQGPSDLSNGSVWAMAEKQ